MRFSFRISPPKFCAKCDYPNIRVGALRLFSRSHCNGVINGNWSIASWHRERSITWRWILSWNSSRTFRFRKWANPNGHGNVRASIPLLGELLFNWQPHMWKDV